jgi:hypothetical protein
MAGSPDLAAAALCRLLVSGVVPDDVDWPALVAAAMDHGLAPALALRLSALGRRPPDDVRAPLRAELAGSAGQAMQMQAALPAVLAALAGAGVACVVLKGADVARRCYPDPAARPMVDLDLLVRPGDLAAAEQALAALSYRRSEPPAPGDDLDQWHKHITLVGGQARWPTIELHWHLVERPWSVRERLDMDWFWQRTETAAAAGLVLPRFTAEALLVHLCLHADGHGVDTHLKWLYDLHLLVQATPDLDWRQVTDAAERFDCGPAIGTVLAATYRWFGTAVPAAASEWAAGRRRPAEQLMADLTRSGALPLALGTLATGATIPDRRARWRVLRAEVVPSRAFMRQRYDVRHDALLPAWYGYRWARGLALAARAAVRFAARRR